MDALVASTSADTTRWQPLKFAAVSERVTKQDGFLKQLDDGTVVAVGPTGQRALYQLDAKLHPGRAITGIKIVALADGSRPGNGPGRAGNGNFVLTEVDIKGPPVDGGGYRTWKASKAKATFEQKGYPAAEAINRQRKESDDGWAIQKGTGRDQSIMIQLEKPYEIGEDGRNLQIHMDQRYANRDHTIGRFRVYVTTDPNPLAVGLPADVVDAVAAESRSDGQTATLIEYLKTSDPETRKAELAKDAAARKRPRDAQLVQLERLARLAAEPLPPNPQLVRLERAERLSGEQVQSARLTAVQDLAWALMNGPAFLFNH